MVIGLCAVRLQYTCDSLRGASDVGYSRCCNRARVDVGLSVSQLLRVFLLTKSVL